MKIHSQVLDENVALCFVQTYWVASQESQNPALSLMVSSMMFETCKRTMTALMHYMCDIEIGSDCAISKVMVCYLYTVNKVGFSVENLHLNII